MQILFAISVFCFLGIVWAAIALARHIKFGQQQNLSIVPAQSDLQHRLLPAHETAQELPPASKIVPDEPPARRPVAPQVELTPAVSVPRTRHTDLNQSVHDIAANKQWILPPHAIHMQRLAIYRAQPVRPESSSNTIQRKPPQPARHGTMELLDPAYFSKDLGDLTDPYQPPRTVSNDRRKSAPSKRYWQS
jgi:hypothetical protein